MRFDADVRIALALGLAVLTAPAALADIEQQPSKEEPAAPPPAPVLTRPPELTHAVDPVYPEAARAAGIAGQVVLIVTIGADGAVVDVTVKSGVDAALDQAAVDAARQLAFTPAEWDGKPGPIAIEYAMSFTLEAAPATPAAPTTAAPAAAAPVTTRNERLVGVVREAVTKDALGGVEVSIGELVVMSDERGRFAFTDELGDGKHRVTFALAGYETMFIEEDVVAGARTEAIVYLERREHAFETVVRQKRAEAEVSRIELSRDEVKSVAGTFGDPLRVLENLPGMARAPFGGGQLLIRGANPEDSAVFFDGVPIPLLYHFQGLKSVVNAEFLETIQFEPGGFGASYGRATAGIVDVQSRKLSMSTVRGSVDANLLDAGFFVAAPLQIGELPKITVAGAARRSYIDVFLPWVLDAALPPGGQAIVAVPVYWDYQAKIETTPIAGHTFSLFAFGSDDDLKVEARGLGNNADVAVGTHTTFHRLVGRWTATLAPGVQHVFQPFIGTTTLSLNAAGGAVSAAADIDTWSWGVRDELKLTLSDTIVLRAGLDYLGETTGASLNVPIPSDVGAFPKPADGFGPPGGGGGGDGDGEPGDDPSQELSASGLRHEPALWAEARLEILPGLKIVPGVRAELLHVTFDPQVADDGTASAGAVSEEWTVDPRVTARWDVVKGSTLKGAVGVYHAPPSSRQLNPVTGSTSIKEQRALQAIVGAEQQLLDDLHLDVQAYVTERDRLVETKQDAQTQTTTFTNDGTGSTVGLELLLRHDLSKHFYGWIAYTLSRTVVDVDPESTDAVLSDYDQTHILTLVAQGKLPWGVSLGGRFRVVSGNPTTLPVGSVHDLDTTQYNAVPATTTTRLPTFHQLDVRVDKKWTFDSLSLTTYLDVLNVYNAANAEGYISDYRSREQQPISSLPILPVFGLTGEF